MTRCLIKEVELSRISFVHLEATNKQVTCLIHSYIRYVTTDIDSHVEFKLRIPCDRLREKSRNYYRSCGTNTDSFFRDSYRAVAPAGDPALVPRCDGAAVHVVLLASRALSARRKHPAAE